MPELPPQPSPPARAERISEERAHAALRRAAELQVEAVERLERQSLTRAADELAGNTSLNGFRRDDIETAAAEAGIAPEFIRQALIEQDIRGEGTTELAPWIERIGSRLLRTHQHSLDLSRAIDASPASVLEAMQRVLPAHPYGMLLIDSIGEPLAGGMLVFEIPWATMISSFQYTAIAVELKQLHATLRPARIGERAGCELTLHGDLRPGMRRNVGAGLALSGLIGVLGTAAALTIATSAGVVLPVIAAGGALGFASGSGVGALGYGAMYRHYLKKMMGELEMLLRVVDTSARTGGAFRPPEGSEGRSGFRLFGQAD